MKLTINFFLGSTWLLFQSNNYNYNKYFIYTAKKRSAEYEKTAGIMCSNKKFQVLKEKKTIVHSKRAEKLIFTMKKTC